MKKNKNGSENDIIDSAPTKSWVQEDHEFRRVLHGYDPEAVNAYIKELSDSLNAASKNYESKMSDMKEELALANRERDSLKERYNDCKASLDAAQICLQTESAEADEYRSTIEKLRAEIERLEEEKQQAPEPAPMPEPEPVPDDVVREYERQIEELNSQNEQLEGILLREKKNMEDSLRRAKTVLKAKIAELEQKTESVSAERDAAVRENSDLKTRFEKVLAFEKKAETLLSENASLITRADRAEAERSEISAMLKEAEDAAAESAAESERLRAELDSARVDAMVLKDKLEQSLNELSELKGKNKEQIYTYSEKYNKLESEWNNDRLNMQKKIRLQGYHISQAESAIEELSKQLEMIKLSLSEQN